MKVIVAGSRHIVDGSLIRTVLNNYIVNKIDWEEVVSGGAKGADRIGERWADSVGLKVVRFNAKWDIHGKKAGPIRNEEMAKYADVLIAFPAKHPVDSAGTGNMISMATKYGLEIHVYPVEV